MFNKGFIFIIYVFKLIDINRKMIDNLIEKWINN